MLIESDSLKALIDETRLELGSVMATEFYAIIDEMIEMTVLSIMETEDKEKEVVEAIKVDEDYLAVRTHAKFMCQEEADSKDGVEFIEQLRCPFDDTISSNYENYCRERGEASMPSDLYRDNFIVGWVSVSQDIVIKIVKELLISHKLFSIDVDQMPMHEIVSLWYRL